MLVIRTIAAGRALNPPGCQVYYYPSFAFTITDRTCLTCYGFAFVPARRRLIFSSAPLFRNMVTTANALLKSQALAQAAQVVKAHRCIGRAAEEASERLLSSHCDILHGMRQPLADREFALGNRACFHWFGDYVWMTLCGENVLDSAATKDPSREMPYWVSPSPYPCSSVCIGG
jgi:hypothetical protein